MDDQLGIVGVDLDQIRPSGMDGIFVVPFILSPLPSQEWALVFDHVYYGILLAEKRRARLVEDHVELLVHEADSLQTQHAVLAQAVEQTNAAVRRRREERSRRRKSPKGGRERERRALRSLREQAGGLKL